MALLPIRVYPDPVLRVRCDEVTEFNEDLRKLVANMVETMQRAPGVGLAAPQVGETVRVAVVDASAGQDPSGLAVLVNPAIKERQGSEVESEGCLSIPDFNERVERAECVEVEAFDLEGDPFHLEAEGLFARVIQHEIDHLNGVLFVDHLRGLRRERARRFLRRLSEVEAT